MREHWENVDPDQLWELGWKSLLELRTPLGLNASSSAGPYATLFGRDSLWMLQFLLESLDRSDSAPFRSFVRSAGSDILTALIRRQGRVIDDEIEEQPGKILHEYRTTLDARLLGYKMPFRDGRSYSGFDQTFLFVVVASRFLTAFPDDVLSAALVRAVGHAVGWMYEFADADGDGLYEYTRRDRRNPVNQVWKDSFDSASLTGFDYPAQPLAWIEVQAYAYQALLQAAEILTDAEADQQVSGAQLRQSASALRRRVNELFWMQSESCYALALDADKQHVPMVTTNAGHALWGELAEPAQAKALAGRLLQNDMLTVYGMRCLSATSPFYAPFGYHRGNIWPFDNAVVAAGFVKYGLHKEATLIARSVARAVLQIGSAVELYIALSPENFVRPSLPRDDVLALRQVPVQNLNQGWTAAALLYLAGLLHDE